MNTQHRGGVVKQFVKYLVPSFIWDNVRELYWMARFPGYRNKPRMFQKFLLRNYWDLTREARSRQILNEYYHGENYSCPDKNRKILIYTADGRPNAGHIGGLADRFKGMISAYRLALELNIDFKINMTSPRDLTDYLLPNKYNWVLAENEICYNPKQSIIYSIRDEDKYSRTRIRGEMSRSLKKYNQIHITTNMDNEREEYGRLFNELFQPSVELEAQIKNNLNKIGDDFISATFRFQQLLGDFEEGNYPILSYEKGKELILRCLWHLEKIHHENINKKILVTSDSITFLTEAGKLPYVFVIPGKIAHIRYSFGLSKEVYMKSFIDYFLLTHSKKIYSVVEGKMYNSGFPKMAALHNKIPFILYRTTSEHCS